MEGLLTGNEGKLKVDCYRAADILSWSITCQQVAIGVPVHNFTGRLANVDVYWSRQTPLALGVWMGRVWWVWHELRIDDAIEDGDISFRVVGHPITQTGF